MRARVSDGLQQRCDEIKRRTKRPTYVRYVSVYRQFEDVGEFIREIQALERRSSRDPYQRKLFKE